MEEQDEGGGGGGWQGAGAPPSDSHPVAPYAGSGDWDEGGSGRGGHHAMGRGDRGRGGYRGGYYGGGRGGGYGNGGWWGGGRGEEEEMLSYDELSGESSEDGFKGHLEALDDVLPEGIDPPGSQVRVPTNSMLRELGNAKLRTLTLTPFPKP